MSLGGVRKICARCRQLMQIRLLPGKSPAMSQTEPVPSFAVLIAPFIPFLLRFLRPGSCATPLHPFHHSTALPGQGNRSLLSNSCESPESLQRRPTESRAHRQSIGRGFGTSRLTPATQFKTGRLRHGADSCKQQRCDEGLRGNLTAMSICRLSPCLF